MRRFRKSLGVAAFPLFGSLSICFPAIAQTTERISVNSSETEVYQASYQPSLSANGAIVAFQSFARRLAPGDSNDQPDIFVRNRNTGFTRRVSLSTTNTEGNGFSDHPAISADARIVAFNSRSSNLVPNDTNAVVDVFVRDRRTGITELASIGGSGQQGNDSSVNPALSGDGRYVAFMSAASNLVSNDNNFVTDVFVRDRISGITQRVSINSAGIEAADTSLNPSISKDGRYIAFDSLATNLVQGDTNTWGDVFIHDRTTGVTERVSVNASGVQGNNASFEPSVSANGRFIAFASWATNLAPGNTGGLVHCYVRDRLNATTERITAGIGGTVANNSSGECQISASGRYVAFVTAASNIVPNDTNNVTDVFVHDRTTQLTQRVSLTASGGQANAQSSEIALSADGLHIAFQSEADNLVAGDTNHHMDVFVRDLEPLESRP